MAKDFLVPISIDTVNEQTADAGVTIEGVLIKDSDIILPVGKAIYFGSANNYIHEDVSTLVMYSTSAAEVIGATSFVAAYGVAGGTIEKRIILDGTQMRVQDDQDSVGFVYHGDYSAIGSLNDRWIPDWAAVTGYVADEAYVHPNHSGHITSVADGATTIQPEAIDDQTSANSNELLFALDEILVHDTSASALTKTRITDIAAWMASWSTDVPGIASIVAAGQVAIWANTGAIGSDSGFTWTNGDTLTVEDKIHINDANTVITEDGSGNLSFTDAVTGTKTLAELASPWTSDTNGITYTAGNVGIGGASDATHRLDVTGSLNMDSVDIYDNGTRFLYYDDVSDNILIGSDTGGGNTFTRTIIIGDAVAGTQSTPSDIIAIGHDILADNSVGGSSNFTIAIGYQALHAATTFNGNVIMGAYAASALPTITTGIVIGSYAGRGGGTSSSLGDIYIGSNAGTALVDSSYNIGIGYDSLKVIDGGYNVAIGYRTGKSFASSSDNNVCIGLSAGELATSGDNNVFIGAYAAGQSSSTGSGNIFIGRLSATGHTGGSGNIIIGEGVSKSAVGVSNEFRLGRNTTIILEGDSTGSSEWIGSAYEARFDTITEYTGSAGITISSGLTLSALPSDDTEDHIVAIDDSTGLLTKRAVSSLPSGSGDVSWGTPTNPYIALGDSVSGNISSSSSLKYDSHILELRESTAGCSISLQEDGGSYWGYTHQFSDNTGYFAYGSTVAIAMSTAGAVKFWQYGDGTFTGTAAYYLAVDSSGNIIEETIPISGVTDHGALTGLTDDDHTQYALRDLAGVEDDIILHTEETGAIDATAGVMYSVAGGHLAAIAISDTTSHTNDVYGAHIVGEDAEVLSQSYDTVTSDGVTMTIGHGTGITFTDNNNNRDFIIGSLLTYGDRFELITGMADGVGFVAGDSFGGTTHSASVALSETTTNAVAALGVGEQTTNDYARIQFEAATAGDFPITVTDEIESIGMAYTADYSTNGTAQDRWIPDYAAVKAYADSVASGVSFGTVVSQIPYTNSGLSDFDYSTYFNYNGTTLNVANAFSLHKSGGGDTFSITNGAGDISSTHAINTGATGWSQSWKAGESSSTTGTHDGGAITIAGGNQTGTGGGDGGNVYIEGGSSVSGSVGEVYLGDGSTGALQAQSDETNVVYYDTTTGKLSYGASGAATFPYIVDDASTSTSIEIAEFGRSSSGTPTDGIGGYLSLSVENSNSDQIPLRIHHLLGDTSDTTEDSLFLMQGYNSGSLANFMSITSRWYNANTYGDESIAIGIGAVPAQTGSIVIGHGAGNNSGTTGSYHIGIGHSVMSSTLNIGGYGIAIGFGAEAQDTGAIAIGRYSRASVTNSIMMGYHSSAQTNSVSNSFEVMFGGVRAFKAGTGMGTQMTINADPDSNLSAVENGCIAYDSTDHEFRAYVNSAWTTFGGGSCEWTADTEGITYSSGNVGINAASTEHHSLYVDGYIFNIRTNDSTWTGDGSGLNSYTLSVNGGWTTARVGNYGSLLLRAMSGSSLYNGYTELATVTTSASDHSSRFVLRQRHGTSDYNENFSLDSGGELTLDKYGVGSFSSGTIAYYLAVDSSGNIMETASAGEWTADTNGITYSSGNVGIGAASTSGQALKVYGTHESGTGMMLVQGATHAYITMDSATDNNTGLYYKENGDAKYLLDYYAAGDYFRIYSYPQTSAVLTIDDGDGQFQFPLYGTGTYEEAEDYLLGVDSSGNMVEVDPLDITFTKADYTTGSTSVAETAILSDTRVTNAIFEGPADGSTCWRITVNYFWTATGGTTPSGVMRVKLGTTTLVSSTSVSSTQCVGTCTFWITPISATQSHVHYSNVYNTSVSDMSSQSASLVTHGTGTGLYVYFDGANDIDWDIKSVMIEQIGL